MASTTRRRSSDKGLIVLNSLFLLTKTITLFWLQSLTILSFLAGSPSKTKTSRRILLHTKFFTNPRPSLSVNSTWLTSLPLRDLPNRLMNLSIMTSKSPWTKPPKPWLSSMRSCVNFKLVFNLNKDLRIYVIHVKSCYVIPCYIICCFLILLILYCGILW